MKVVYNAICTPPADAEVLTGPRDYCPNSDQQFLVAPAELSTIEFVQQEVRDILEDTIVVGFDITNDLKVLGISLPPEKVRDVQTHFNAERCSKPDLVGKGLPTLDGSRPKHSLKNLSVCLLGRSIQDGPHSALVDARATMELYLQERGMIEQKYKR